MKKKSSRKTLNSNSNSKKRDVKLSFKDMCDDLLEEDKNSDHNLKSISRKSKSPTFTKTDRNSRSSKKLKTEKLNNSNISKSRRNSSHIDKIKNNIQNEDYDTNSVTSDDDLSSFDSSNFLNNFNSIFNLNTNHFHSQKNSQTNSQLDEVEDFQYDHSLIKQLDIELIFVFPDKEKEIMKFMTPVYQKIVKFFETNKFDYYEYSNPRVRNNPINSQIDNLNYDFLYEKNLSFNLALVNTENDKNLKTIKSINFLTAMSSVHQNYITKNCNEMESDCFFYFIMPLHSFYFFKYENNFLFKEINSDIEESGVIVSNLNTFLEKNLNENGIKFEKLQSSQNGKKSSKRKNFASGINLLFLHNETNENDMANIISTTENTNIIQSKEEPPSVYICNYYKVLFFNYLLNEYEESSLNIYAPFSFDYSTYRQCKVMIDSNIKNEKMYVMNLKIFGCLFQTYLSKIISFLEQFDYVDPNLDNTWSSFSFSLKYHHFMKTGSFYVLNKNLKNVVEKINYRNKKYFIKYKS